MPLVIKRCRSLHMISFFPDGLVQSKINLCSCSNCIEGDFTSCLIEKDRLVLVTDASDDDSSSEDFENDFDVDEESDTEMYELRAETVNDVLTEDTCIALYSSSNALELFFLCKVLDFGVANEDLFDSYNHVITKVCKYLRCQYYQKTKESNGKVHYKLLPKNVLAVPTEVLSPFVNLNPLNANPEKWSNTLKQIIGNLPTICLSVFDHFMNLALKGLIAITPFQWMNISGYVIVFNTCIDIFIYRFSFRAVKF